MTSSLKIFVEAASGQFDAAMAQSTKDIKIASMEMMARAAKILKTKGRADIAAAGFGLKWQNALRVQVFPKGGTLSAHPTLQVYSKIGYSQIFETGGTILGSPLLWLPLPDAPMGSGGRRITPSEYRAKIGHPLYSIKRPGKAPLLGANVRVTDTRAKGISVSLLRRGRNPGGRGVERLVPLYVGVDAVTLRDRFSITEIAQATADTLPQIFASIINKG